MTFRLGPIPVRVRWTFFLLALFLLAHERDPRKLGVWVGIVFLSVLAHELGHALAGKVFGLVPQIELHGMGGTTSWQNRREDLGRGRSIVISLAGPFAGFLVAALVLVSTKTAPPELLVILFGARAPATDLRRFAIDSALWVNAGWGIFNLLPLLPLDGGNVMRSVLDIVSKGRGEKAARLVSMLVALILAAWAAIGRNWWLLMMSFLFLMTNFQALQQRKQVAFDARLVLAIEKANLALAVHEGEQAIAILAPALVPEVSLELRAVAVRLLAYAMLLESRWEDVFAILATERVHFEEEDIERFARTARELEFPEQAARIAALKVQPATT